MRKRLFFVLSLLLIGRCVAAQSPAPPVEADSVARPSRPLPYVDYGDSATYDFAVRGHDTLQMNFFQPWHQRRDRACVVYLYGGAFTFGQRDDRQTRLDVNALLQEGFSVAAIDYRKYLATVDLDNYSKLQWLDLLDTAITQAASDCAAAVAFVVRHAAMLNIDTSKIILTGNSAGAIAVLQLDFARANNLRAAAELPVGFRPAAVVAYAGAIYNPSGGLTYAVPPAPTAFFYGDNDRVVPYKGISLCKKHYGGGRKLSSLFEDNDYAFWTFVYKGHGHEVSGYLYRTLDEYNAFVDAALAGRKIHYTTECSANELKITKASTFTLKDFMQKDKIEEGAFEEPMQ